MIDIFEKGLNKAAKEIYAQNKAKGFWDKDREVGTLLMLCTSELAEALEADRKGQYANLEAVISRTILGAPFADVFVENVKDTFEDELADTIIRVLDICGSRGIDIEKHINLKLVYNATRVKMHGKKY